MDQVHKRHSTDGIHNLLDSGKIGLWKIKLPTNILSIYGEACLASLFGLEQGILTLSFNEYCHKLCHPEDSETMATAIKYFVKLDRVRDREYRVWNAKSKTWRWCYTFGMTLSENADGGRDICGIIQGIPASRSGAPAGSPRTRELEEEERMRLMIDANPLCCNFRDENGIIIDCNLATLRMFGLANKDEYRQRFLELSPTFQPNGKNSIKYSREMLKQAFETGYQRFEWLHRNLKGELIPSEVTLVRGKRGGRYVMVGYIRDLREMKITIARMHNTAEELRKAKDLAEKNARAKSDFLANISHEIRTPMNGILGMTNLMYKTELSTKQRNYLDKTKQSATLLLRIINDILDFSKIDAGKLEMENIPFSLEEVLCEISQMGEMQIADKKLFLDVNIDPGTPNDLVGDPVRLKQILLNLTSNAIKFTPTGRINIEVAMLASPHGQAILRFAVRDTGIGMSPEQVTTLFEPFTQADSSTTRKYGGTGLGLSICKSLVALMHGKISCESSLGLGTCFSFTVHFSMQTKQKAESSMLPAATAPKPQNVQAAKNSIQAPQISRPTVKKCPNLVGTRILLAEDNEINQMIALELLGEKGFVVDVAENGLQALEMIGKTPYALVLMDIQMPEMDGLSATRKIRADTKYKNLPIVAMTAHAMSGDREKSLGAGMNDHLSKPIDPEHLYATLNKWLHAD